MSHHDEHENENEKEAPGLVQRLHAATGDRDAEAEALADRAGDVDVDDAKVAVQRAHGEAGVGQPMPERRHPDEALAEPEDAREVRDDPSS